MTVKKEISQEVFSRLYREFLDKDERTRYIQEILSENPQNSILGIGSHVYGNLTLELYKIWRRPPNADIDLLIKDAKGFAIPEGWDLGFTGYGTTYIQKDNVKIDLNFLVNSIGATLIVNPTLQDFLGWTPLNVQSILYDFFSGMIEGEEGMKALEQRIIRVNNYHAAYNQSQIEKISVKTLLKNKAAELAFGYEYPPRDGKKVPGTRLKKLDKN